MEFRYRDFSTDFPKAYCYAFNGMERDDEWNGDGNSYDFGARIYDSRTGRWLARDPLENSYPNFSPYCAFALNPLVYVDPDGRKIRVTNTYSKKQVQGYMDEQFGADVFRINKRGQVKVNTLKYFREIRKLDKNSPKAKLMTAYRTSVRSYSKELEVHVFSKSKDATVTKNPQLVASYKWDPASKTAIPDKYRPAYTHADGTPGYTVKLQGLEGVTSYAYDDVMTLIGQDAASTMVFAGFKVEDVDPAIIQQEFPGYETTKSDIGSVVSDNSGAESSVFLHEVLDHFYEELINGQDQNRPKEEQIIWHNRALENVGNQNRRDGSDHDGK